ncbi:hypothetical protein Ahy_A06g026486 isoform C [Arachis hypogaea]|uniref:Uncharacterized protein n=1 Tax=Arachis hypogaea TaxID=3818 RepID=A0A445CKQ4_ARAHY|nr:hypothetical protein Ahy_A06g026486 isoform C [Arachis hypogaea]
MNLRFVLLVISIYHFLDWVNANQEPEHDIIDPVLPFFIYSCISISLNPPLPEVDVIVPSTPPLASSSSDDSSSDGFADDPAQDGADGPADDDPDDPDLLDCADVPAGGPTDDPLDDSSSGDSADGVDIEFGWQQF